MNISRKRGGDYIKTTRFFSKFIPLHFKFTRSKSKKEKEDSVKLLTDDCSNQCLNIEMCYNNIKRKNKIKVKCNVKKLYKIKEQIKKNNA